MKGFSSEIDPRAMPEGFFPEFTQVTSRGGAIRPRKSDEDYTPPAGSAEEWKLSKLGGHSIAEPYSADDRMSWLVYVSMNGGTPKIRNHAANEEEDLLMGTPASGPVKNEAADSVTIAASGEGPNAKAVGAVPAGGSASYALAWNSPIGKAESGLSTVEVFDASDYLLLLYDLPYYVGTPPAVPAQGDVLTNSTKGATATVRHAVLLHVHQTGANRYFRGAIAVKGESKSIPSVWQSGDAISWPGVVGGPVLAADETSADVTPSFQSPENPPAGVERWSLYRMEEGAGIWRKCGEGELGETLSDFHFFPYGSSSRADLLPHWPGPMDNEYLPETLASSMTAAKAVSFHKGCLFVAEGRKIRYSEPEQPRYFREWAVLEADSDVMAIVSRDETAEVYTKTSVKYITGSAPYFELRETGITEGPVAAKSIVKTDLGTFALFADGIYVVGGNSRKNLSAGVNTPFIESLEEPWGAAGGASKGVYHLVDASGRCLAYDWEEDEWFRRDFPSQPRCFLYLEDAGCLVARFFGNPDFHKKIGSGDDPVEWAARWPDEGGGRLFSLPPRAFVEGEGEMTLTYAVDGETEAVIPVSGTGEVPLPLARGRWASLRLSGEGTPADTVVRAAEFGG